MRRYSEMRRSRTGQYNELSVEGIVKTAPESMGRKRVKNGPAPEYVTFVIENTTVADVYRTGKKHAVKTEILVETAGFFCGYSRLILDKVKVGSEVSVEGKLITKEVEIDGRKEERYVLLADDVQVEGIGSALLETMGVD